MATRVSITGFDSADKLLAKVDLELRNKIVRGAVRKAGIVVLKEAKKTAPNSMNSGTRELWSKATKASRKWVQPFSETLKVVTREYGNVFVAVVGPEWPESNIGHLIEDGHKLVAWGRPVDMFVPGSHFLEQAADSTQAEQAAAFRRWVKMKVDKLVNEKRQLMLPGF